MKKDRRIKRKNDLVPFPVIREASEGNVEALNQVLEHYKSYIKTLSTKTVVDEYGQVYYCVDEELKRRLEIRLITATLKFKAEKR